MKRVADATLSRATKAATGLVTQHFPISDVAPKSILSNALPEDIQKRFSKVRTDLDRFSKSEMTLLTRHGYEVAYNRIHGDGQLKRHLESTSLSPGDSWTGTRVLSTAQLLDKARRRSIGLVGLRDWVTYALIGCVVFAAGLVYVPFGLQRATIEDQQAQLNTKAAEVAKLSRPTPTNIPIVTVVISPSDSNAGEQTVSNVSYDQIYVAFSNPTAGVVKLYWVDFNGVESFFDSLQPGEVKRFRTFVGHLWIAKAETGTVLMKYVAKAT